MIDREAELRFLIKGLIIGFIVGLVISGVTAFPLPAEIALLTRMMGMGPAAHPQDYSGLPAFLLMVRDGLQRTESTFPFLFYGYDWLAFGHIVIAIAFLGPLKDPVKNIWIVEWGMIACVLVIPLALICGSVRGIPFAWQMIDCSFGVVGIVPLWICRRMIVELSQVSRR